MSTPLYIRCECKEETLLMETGFPYLAWYDILSVLSKLEVDPATWFDLDFFSDETRTMEFDPAALDGWVQACREAMDENSDALPELFHIWRKDGDRLIGGAGYFWHDGSLMMVDTSYQDIIVRPLKPEIAEGRLKHLNYDPPRSEKVLPTLNLERSQRHSEHRPEFTIRPEEFNRLFKDTGHFMEVAPFRDDVEDGLRGLEGIIAHAESNDETIFIQR